MPQENKEIRDERGVYMSSEEAKRGLALAKEIRSRIAGENTVSVISSLITCLGWVIANQIDVGFDECVEDCAHELREVTAGFRKALGKIPS